jgi:hypothetical protein
MVKLALLLLCSLPLLAQSPDLPGVWELDLSKEPAGRQVPESMRIRIDRQGPGFLLTLRVKSRGQSDQMSLRYIPGQETRNEMRGAPMTSRAEWDGTTLVVQSTATFGARQLRTAERFTASGDVLTLTQRNQFDTEPEREEVHMLNRRPLTSWEPDAAPKLAEEVYKNIQIMKGIPAPRLQIVMANLTRWLGVECSYCHVGTEFEKDDKPGKQTARKMFLMVRAIGNEHFPGSNPVTCWTCHRGAAKPQSLPPQ